MQRNIVRKSERYMYVGKDSQRVRKMYIVQYVEKDVRESKKGIWRLESKMFRE